MRFFTVALSALAAFTSVVSAITDSKENPITFPTAGTVLTAGKKATIRWDPTTQGTITLVLRKGTDTNLATLETITSDAPNSGSFDWTPDPSLPAGKDYAIQIISGTLGNYSPKFEIESMNTATTSTSTSTSSTSTTSTKSSTSTSTSTTSTSSSSTTTGTDAAGITSTANRTMTSHSTTATRPTESTSATGTGGAAPNINGAGQLSSSFALVFCVLAGMVYLN